MGKGVRRTTTHDGHAAARSDGFTATLGGDSSAVPAVRQATRELANRTGFGDRAGDLVLALDELVANAQEHGTPPITVRGWHDGRLVVTVTDSGPGFDYAKVVRDHPPVMLGKRGRGLWIVRQVTDHVHADSSPGGTTVRVELTHEPQIGA